jgi:hypothetical protein
MLPLVARPPPLVMTIVPVVLDDERVIEEEITNGVLFDVAILPTVNSPSTVPNPYILVPLFNKAIFNF